MKSAFWKLILRAQTLLREDGQDLVEYALVIALIAFAATAGVKTFAGKLSTAFSNMGTAISTDVG